MREDSNFFPEYACSFEKSDFCFLLRAVFAIYHFSCLNKAPATSSCGAVQSQCCSFPNLAGLQNLFEVWSGWVPSHDLSSLIYSPGCKQSDCHHCQGLLLVAQQSSPMELPMLEMVVIHFSSACTFVNSSPNCCYFPNFC